MNNTTLTPISLDQMKVGEEYYLKAKLSSIADNGAILLEYSDECAYFYHKDQPIFTLTEQPDDIELRIKAQIMAGILANPVYADYLRGNTLEPVQGTVAEWTNKLYDDLIAACKNQLNQQP